MKIYWLSFPYYARWPTISVERMLMAVIIVWWTFHPHVDSSMCLNLKWHARATKWIKGGSATTKATTFEISLTMAVTSDAVFLLQLVLFGGFLCNVSEYLCSSFGPFQNFYTGLHWSSGHQPKCAVRKPGKLIFFNLKAPWRGWSYDWFFERYACLESGDLRVKITKIYFECGKDLLFWWRHHYAELAILI